MKRHDLQNAAIFWVATALIATLANSTSAADLTWTGSGGVFFNDSGNWTPGQSPTGADDLTFPATADKFSLVISGSQSGRFFSFEGGEYSIEGGTSSQLNSTEAYVNNGGTLNVAGADSQWNIQGGLRAGDSTEGTINISDNADVDHLGLWMALRQNGSATVNVTNGAQLGTTNSASSGRIGFEGTGTFNINTGARSDMSDVVVGYHTTATGTINVADAGTRFVANSADLHVGRWGVGSLNVNNGGRVDVTGIGNLSTGFLESGTGNIALDAGVANVGSRIYVGQRGTGTFSATNGSSVTSELQFVLGDEAVAAGTATFDNSTLNVTNSNHDLIVGRQGLGQITVTNGSTVTIANDILIGTESMLDNRLVVTGGSTVSTGTRFGDDILVGDTGNGTLIVSESSVLTTRNLNIGTYAGSNGSMILEGAGTTANLGFLFVANSGTGDLTVSGGATMNLETTESPVANLTVGDDTSSMGLMTITGSDADGNPSQVRANRRAEIGGSGNEVGGTGTLNVENGGQLETVGAVIGLKDAADVGPGGTGTVNVNSNASWKSTGTITVGQIGQGQLNITSGGRVESTAVLIGDNNNGDTGQAAVAVSGTNGTTASTLDISGVLTIGDDRAASLTISNGAVVNSGTDMGNTFATIGNAGSADGAIVTVDNATWNEQGTRIKVGRSGGSAAAPSTLKITNGGQVNADLIMVSDDSASSHGLVEIDGVGSAANARVSVIGDVGPGTLKVTNGGAYNVAEIFDISGSGTGTVEIGLGTFPSSINAPGATAVGRSNNSTGTLTVHSRGTLTTGELQIAKSAGSTGTIRANGGGTINVAGVLSVGGTANDDGGIGRLTVSGSSVDADTVTVRDGSSVSITAGTLRLGTLNRMSGSDFSLSANGKLVFTGDQVLDASRLADVFNNDPTLKSHPLGSPGGMTLAVEGAATLTAPLRLDGGFFTAGSIDSLSNLDWDRGTLELTAMDVNIETGGLFGNQLLLQNDQNLVVRQSTVNNGLINATGSLLNFAGGLTNNADIVLINSTVNGQVNNPAGSTLTVVGQANFNDIVTGAGNFYGPGTTIFNGGFSPGDSPSIVTFEGDMISAQSLFVEIGGNDNSMMAEYDQLLIDGVAAIGGLLDVSLIDLSGGTNGEYVPQLGDSFELITATGGINGDFGQLSLPTLTGGLEWQIDQTNVSWSLNVVMANTASGDFDMDGDFDGADVDALVAQIAGSGTDPLFDMNGDGQIDQSDLNQWLAIAGAENLASGGSYLPGDANLDGAVDVSDFNIWNANKFTTVAAWTRGDFTANGSIDVSDFNSWNSNKFQIADAAAVPEPSGIALCLLACVVLFLRRR
ncbi:MAG: hypothetical protein AAF497_00180 [Planctomycetota bacterium]